MMYRLGFLVTILTVVGIGVYSTPELVLATDTFTVTQAISTLDPIPPTVPANFTVTPVASDQIDLAWDASSDNISVGGYQVFRDATQIATTSLTTFSDTGLSASTTYAYFITAFDTSFNFATPTATLSTTTFAAAPPAATSSPTSTPSTQTGFRLLQINDIAYEIGEHTITLAVVPNMPTQMAVRWGRTGSFESGYTATEVYRRDHHTVIEGLAPGTVYEIEITLTDYTGRQQVREQLTLTTLTGADGMPPTNATDFSAVWVDGEVRLDWRNPDDDDFAYVRVLSNDKFYPTYPGEGWLVYQGTSESVTDDRPLPIGTHRYYTIFVYDVNGNTSSGAVTAVFRLEAGSSGFAPVSPAATSTVTLPDGTTFAFSDLVFIQDGRVIEPVEGLLTLAGEYQTTIRLPYALVPEALKTIVVSLQHPIENTTEFSFLLRINADKSAYEATIGALQEPGLYRARATLFNYQTDALYTTLGTVKVVAAQVASFEETLTRQLSLVGKWVGLVTLVLLLLWLLLLRSRRRSQAEDSSL